MAGLAYSNAIRAMPLTNCALCGRKGDQIYADLQDRLFGVNGVWNMLRCSNSSCGLLWLDPMPVAECIPAAYENYYTHTSAETAHPHGFFASAYGVAKTNYLASRYGYSGAANSPIGSFLKWLLYLLPLRRSNVDDEVRRLRARPGGRLLDVGCGSGEWLCRMRNLGWKVEGHDPDARAVAVARGRRLKVAQGSLEEQAYPDGSFDAIMAYHVIEHVPDPVATLAECRRVLKAGGELLLSTPNSASLGHRIFRSSWRGLEPPRHLYLFSPLSLRAALARAGFRHADVQTLNSAHIWRVSVALWAQHTFAGCELPTRLRILAHLLTVLEEVILLAQRDVGECVSVRAFKQ